eukprot:g1914.t1
METCTKKFKQTVLQMKQKLERENRPLLRNNDNTNREKEMNTCNHLRIEYRWPQTTTTAIETNTLDEGGSKHMSLPPGPLLRNKNDKNNREKEINT